MFKLFIVEDDQHLVRLLEDHLQKFGYETRAVQDFDTVKQQFEQYSPHLVLMDVNLPRFDGYYWCRQIRSLSTCPILFISARESKMDQVMALENGADDYMTKPFDYEIVTAKINSQLRRAYGSYASAQTDNRLLEVGGLTLDSERLQLNYQSQSVELSFTEMKMMNELMKRSSLVVSRDRLLETIWDDQAFVDDNTLNVYMTRMRKKLAQLGIEHGLQTIRGQGYRLNPDWGLPQ
ncbi:response regulator transcription factor [Paenibacillus radicis (ex Gao et al. 2016)]|uniref:DNA-binding response regulator n=1 Tax=Paenibacillus radicis (ex Gao et al. 2016) TaxID=1737354 RepID=A0A917M1P8_9BACL|nr:response regulator transcription factor [Paenibacillus radicis (ex Gao et al. 2016)]GGG71077.1 DNA-binding response regulator [Paenibacillus radicis (ex Gao et al. 2016)]